MMPHRPRTQRVAGQQQRPGHIPCAVFRGSPAHAAASGCGLLTRQHRSALILATWSGGPRNFGGSRELGNRAGGKQHGLDWTVGIQPRPFLPCRLDCVGYCCCFAIKDASSRVGVKAHLVLFT